MFLYKTNKLAGCVQPNKWTLSCYFQQDATVHRSVKPHILSVFGDVALAIGSNFTTYFEVVIATLNQASVTTVDKVSEFGLVLTGPTTVTQFVDSTGNNIPLSTVESLLWETIIRSPLHFVLFTLSQRKISISITYSSLIRTLGGAPHAGVKMKEFHFCLW